MTVTIFIAALLTACLLAPSQTQCKCISSSGPVCAVSHSLVKDCAAIAHHGHGHDGESANLAMMQCIGKTRANSDENFIM